MGDAQSAQREAERDAAAAAAAAEEEEEEERSPKVNDAQTVQNTGDKAFKNSGQISEINGKAGSSVAAFNSHCEDEIPAEAIISPDKDTGKPLKKEETQRVEITQKKLPDDPEPNEETPMEIIEMEAKQNDINETFRKFFNNIGLKLTVKRGSAEQVEVLTHAPEEDTKDTSREIKSERAEQNMNANIVQEVTDNDSTTCPTLTDGTSEDFLESPEEKSDTKVKAESDNADAGTTSSGEDPNPLSPSIHEEEVAASPFKKFLSTGIFSSLRKKKKPGEDVADIETKEAADTTEQRVQDQQQNKEINPGVVETLSVVSPQTINKAKSPSMTEPEILSSQEKDKVQASPMKRLLSGSSLKRLSKKQRSRKSSDGKMSDSGEHTSDHFLSSTESSENQKEGSHAQPSAEIAAEEDSAWTALKKLMTPKKLMKKPLDNDEAPMPVAVDEAKPGEGEQIPDDGKQSNSGEHVSDHFQSSTESADKQKEESPMQPTGETAGEENSAWASFKKLMTPKKRMKTPSLDNNETQIPLAVDEVKPSEGEQISDHSTEEGRKRKDSSVSWEAVLCGSGRRRSRKTSDSENETPQTGNGNNKQDSEQKQGIEPSLQASNEVHEIVASSPERAESPSESDEGSTWKLFKKLVTPKRKGRDEDENKDNIQSDSESTLDESFFSIKKLFPGRNRKKSDEKQDQVSSDEADKEVASVDEDSETPAVVPLSEFDTAETGVHIQTHADVESYVQKEADELKQDLLDEKPEPVLACDNLQIEATTVPNKEEALANEASTNPVAKEEPGEVTELISKHQQLSDIPEEGIITETMATPASVTEEVVRDDTIAEDLIEITSEAMTAPEPVDVTLTDETEMISAVSQLSESSKTSGNATPVSHDYDVKDTEMLLQQAAETISTNPNVAPECSGEPSSEGIVYSVWHQILKTFGKEKPGEDATSINTELHFEEIYTIEDRAATKPENVSDVNKAISAEILSDVPTEEFDTAEIAVEKVDNESDVPQLQERTKEPEIIEEATSTAAIAATVENKSLDGAMEEKLQIISEKEVQTIPCVPEQVQVGVQESTIQSLEQEIPISTAVPSEEMYADEPKHTAEHLSEAIIVTEDKEPPLDAPETEESQVSKLDSGEGDVISEDVSQIQTVKDEPREEKVTLAEVNVELEQEVFEAVEPTTLDSEPSSPQFFLKKEEISENAPAAETVTDVPKEEKVALPEVNVEPVDVSKIENVKEPEVLQAVPAVTLDSGPSSPQLLDKEEISVDIPTAETVKDETKEETQNEPKKKIYQKMFQFILDVPAAVKTVKDEAQKETEPLSEVDVEPRDASKIEQAQETEVLEAVPATTSDSEAGSPLLLEKEEIPADVLAAVKTAKDEPKEEKVALPEVNVDPADASKIEHVEEPQGLEAVPAETALHSEPSSPKLLEEEDIPQAVPPPETVMDESKNETELLTEIDVEPGDTSKIEHIQEPEMVEAVTAASLDSEPSSLQLPRKDIKKEEISEDVPPPETVKDEPKEKREPHTEIDVKPGDASEIEHVQEPKVVEAVIATSLDSEPSSPQLPRKEEITDVPPPETVEDESKAETEPLSKPEKIYQKMIHFILDVPAAVKIVKDDLKEETESFTEVDVVPVDGSKIEAVLETQGLEAEPAATLNSEQSSPKLLKKEEIPEDIPPPETVKDEPKEKTEPHTEIDVKPGDTSEIEHIQEPEMVEAVTAASLDSEPSSPHLPRKALKKEEISEDAPPPETVEDEPKAETDPLSEPKKIYQKIIQFILDVPAAVKTVKDDLKEETESFTEVDVVPVDGSKIEAVLETQGLEAEPAATLNSEPSSPTLLKKEETREDIPPPETVKDEPKETTEPHAEIDVKPGDASEIEHVQEPDMVEALTPTSLDSEPGSPQLPRKEEISEDVPPPETGEDEPKAETEPLSEPKQIYQKMIQFILDVPAAVKTEKDESKEEKVALPQVNVEPVEASKIQHTQKPEELDAVQVATLDSGPSSPQILRKGLEKEEISDNVPPPDTVKDEPKKETELHTEVDVEPGDTPKVKQIQEIEMLQAVPAMTLDSEAGSPPLLEKEEISGDILPAETVKDESQEETQDEPEKKIYQKVFQFILDVPATVKTVIDEGKVEKAAFPEDNVDPADVSKIEHVEEPQALEAAPTTTLEPETSCPQLLKKEEISEDVPQVKTITVEPTKETVPFTEGNVEPVDASKLANAQEPEMLEAIPAIPLETSSPQLLTTVTDESKQATEVNTELGELPVDPVAIQPNPRDNATETKASKSEHAAAQSVEESSAQEKQISETVPEPAPDIVIASVTDETERKLVAQLDEASEIKNDQKTEIIMQDVQFEHEDVDALQTLTAVHTPSVNKETSSAQVLEKAVFSEEAPTPCVDSGEVSEEPTHEVHPSTVKVSAEGENVLPGVEIKTDVVKNDETLQVSICNLKDVSAAIADVLIEETSEIQEPLIDRIASETEFNETIEAASPLEQEDVIRTAEEASEVVTMQALSVECEDNHRIQVQVVDVDITSSDSTVETTLEVVVTQAQEVIDVCHETIDEVENLFGTPDIEEVITKEENTVIVEEVTQHMKNLSETIPESEVVSLEQEDIRQPGAVIDVSEMAESESNEVDDEEVMKDSTPTLTVRQDELCAVISDSAAIPTERVSEDSMQTPEVPESLDVSIQDQKEHLEESKSDIENPEVFVTAEDAITSSEELAMQIVNQLETAQAPIVAPSNTVSTPPDMSEVGIQAEEPGKATQGAESEKETELTGDPIQATEITEPAENLDSTERVAITNQQLDVGPEAMETIEPEEQIKSTEGVTPDAETEKTKQAVRQTEKTEEILSQPEPSEVPDQEPKAEEPDVEREEENEQDVWLDAEEDICTQEETDVSHPGPQTELECEGASDPKTEDVESQEEEMHQTEGVCGSESDGEDFAVALEDFETMGVTTQELE